MTMRSKKRYRAANRNSRRWSKGLDVKVKAVMGTRFIWDGKKIERHKMLIADGKAIFVDLKRVPLDAKIVFKTAKQMVEAIKGKDVRWVIRGETVEKCYFRLVSGSLNCFTANGDFLYVSDRNSTYSTKKQAMLKLAQKLSNQERDWARRARQLERRAITIRAQASRI